LVEWLRGEDGGGDWIEDGEEDEDGGMEGWTRRRGGLLKSWLPVFQPLDFVFSIFFLFAAFFFVFLQLHLTVTFLIFARPVIFLLLLILIGDVTFPFILDISSPYLHYHCPRR